MIPKPPPVFLTRKSIVVGSVPISKEKKDRDRKHDELKLKENRILKLEDKLGDIKNYVCKNFPQKLDELAKII